MSRGFRSQALDRPGAHIGASRNSPETHPMPGDKNKEVERDPLEPPDLETEFVARPAGFEPTTPWFVEMVFAPER